MGGAAGIIDLGGGGTMRQGGADRAEALATIAAGLDRLREQAAAIDEGMLAFLIASAGDEARVVLARERAPDEPGS